MTEFGTPDDNGQNKQEKSFSDGPSDKGGSDAKADISQSDLDALRNRDESAQQHISQLESENGEMREQIADLENKLASAATVDEVLERIQNKQSGDQQSVDPDKVVDAVERRLQQKAQRDVADKNMTTVEAKVTEVYGGWEKGNEAVMAEARSLGMSADEVNLLAQQSPDAFAKLFLPEDKAKVSQQSVASAAQRTSAELPPDTSGTRDAAYYKAMRTNKDPRVRDQFWSPETQAQMRRDLFGAT